MKSWAWPQNVHTYCLLFWSIGWVGSLYTCLAPRSLSLRLCERISSSILLRRKRWPGSVLRYHMLNWNSVLDTNTLEHLLVHLHKKAKFKLLFEVVSSSNNSLPCTVACSWPINHCSKLWTCSYDHWKLKNLCFAIMHDFGPFESSHIHTAAKAICATASKNIIINCCTFLHSIPMSTWWESYLEQQLCCINSILI